MSVTQTSPSGAAAASASVSSMRSRDNSLPVRASSLITVSGVVTHSAPRMQCGHAGVAPRSTWRGRSVFGSRDVIRVALRP